MRRSAMRLAGPVYGLRSRLRVLRQEGRDDPSLLRWYPWPSLLDELAFLDLTTPWEQAWVERRIARAPGSGAVVELGPWLGAVSQAIARGLERAGRTDGFDTYDTFTFTDIEQRTAGTPLADRFSDGSSFRPLFDRRMAAHPGVARVHQGDITAARWPGGPIGLLFVDLAKTWDVWSHVRSEFVRAVPVDGVIVQQDWAHVNTPWLHLWHHRWRSHLVPLPPINHSTAVAFEVTSALPDDAFRADQLASYPPDEVRRAFAWSQGLVHPKWRSNVAGAEVMLHALHGEHADAIEAMMRAAAHLPVDEELASVAIPELARRMAERSA